MNTTLIPRLAGITLATITTLNAAAPPNGTLLFQNLRTFGSSAFRVTDEAAPVYNDGPKGLAAADLDGDGRNDLVAGNNDGTVAVLFGAPGGALEPALYVLAGSPSTGWQPGGLRDVIVANVKGDPRPEIIAAHPFDGKIYIFSVTGGAGSRVFSPMQILPTWTGARGVAAGDFNGDGKMDLAVGGRGDGFREYRGDGAGGFTALPAVAGIAEAVNTEQWDDEEGAKPVFTLHAWRHLGETRDRVVVSFANARSVWFLNGPAVGQPLAVTSLLPLPEGEDVYDLAMGYLTLQSRTTGEPDLLTASIGMFSEVRIRSFSPGLPGLAPYPVAAQQVLTVPGGPRGVSIADVNNDTWPDLLVVSRNSDTLHLFRNQTGLLSLRSQSPTSWSPRDVVTADFDGNGRPDAAVINRKSQNISIHRIDPGSANFMLNPRLQLNTGGAASTSVRDLDGDGRLELLTVNAVTGEVGIQNVSSSGQLLPAVRYWMGARPQSVTTPDINGDGRLDLECACLGDTQAGGGLKYRLQLPDHTFGPLTDGSSQVPMLGQVVADFNGDGLADRATLYADCRLGLAEGTPTGLLERRVEFFVYESRVLTAVDLDGDGDLDIVGAGAYGTPVVVENTGGWFTGGEYKRTLLEGPKVGGVYAANVQDRNGDGVLDLTVYSGEAVMQWYGAPGLTFTFAGSSPAPPSTLATTSNVNTARLDYDGDGVSDDFVLGPKSIVTFYKGTPGGNGQWWTAMGTEKFSVPSTTTLIGGDLDGDGKPDLVGIGDYLWIALSGSPAPALVPTATPTVPKQISSVVINEVLASTSKYIPPGTIEPQDCVEIYNGGDTPVELAGWKLRRVTGPGEVQLPDFTFPQFTLGPEARTVVYCSSKNGPWQAPFKLPEEGATLRLLNPAGDAVDTLAFGPQQPDVSYSRLTDSSRTLVYNPLPSIGTINYDNGSLEPVISFKGVDLTLLKQNTWRFRAQAWSPSGMFTLVISWRELTSSPNPRSGIIPLYDDSWHDDGGTLDGVFAGDWDQPLPPGTAIEFYITGTDLGGESATEPKGRDFSNSSRPVANFTLAIPATNSGWEISEVVPRNQGGLRDETGSSPDWAELRYTGAGTVPVEGLFLSDSLFGFAPSDLYDVSSQGDTVTPGTSHVVFLDNSAPGGADPRHAPFKASGEGDTLYLLRRLPSGATELVDWVKVPELAPNVAYARLGPGGQWVQATPTPDAPNAPGGNRLYLVPAANGGTDSIFVFQGAGRIEASYDLQSWTTVLPAVPDNGIEHAYREVKGEKRFFRVR